MAAAIAAVVSALSAANSADSSNSDTLISQAGKNAAANAKNGQSGFTPVAASFAPGVSGAGAGSMPVRTPMPMPGQQTGATSSPSFGAIATPNQNSGQPATADTLDVPEADTGAAGDTSPQSTGAQPGVSQLPPVYSPTLPPDESAPAGSQSTGNATPNGSGSNSADTISKLGGLGVSLGQLLGAGGGSPQGSFPAPGGNNGGYQPTALQLLQAAQRKKQMGLM